MNNALESIGNKADPMEETIRELKGRNLELIRVEEERELRGVCVCVFNERTL